jgi:hypothetical protein
VATGFPSYKEIKDLCNTKHVSVVVYSCKLSERKRKESLDVPYRSPVECGPVLPGKRDSTLKNIALFSGSNIGR